MEGWDECHGARIRVIVPEPAGLVRKFASLRSLPESDVDYRMDESLAFLAQALSG
jgi:hypothetical protein